MQALNKLLLGAPWAVLNRLSQSPGQDQSPHQAVGQDSLAMSPIGAGAEDEGAFHFLVPHLL